MRIATSLYTVYAVLIFLMLCLIYIPIMTILCQKMSWHPLALRIHTVWAWSYFSLAFIRVKVEKKFTPEPNQQYILCANHFSFLDIPVLLLMFQPKFIGTSALNRIPLFGYFYRKIHITVDRSSAKSRAKSLKETKRALEEHFNVAFFPEGGVKVAPEDIPQMVAFRNGAFLLSVEKNIPIIPVTMPFNYRILPDKSPIRLHPHACKIIIHEPIFPQNNSDAEIERIKTQVNTVIQEELNAHHRDKVGMLE